MGRKELTGDLGIEAIQKRMQASLSREAGITATTRLLDSSNANVYCQQSDSGTSGPQHEDWAEMRDGRHPIELY